MARVLLFAAVENRRAVEHATATRPTDVSVAGQTTFWSRSSYDGAVRRHQSDPHKVARRAQQTEGERGSE